LLDCRLLAEVYIELTGGRQRGLSLAVSAETFAVAQYEARPDRTIRHIAVSQDELAAHAKFLQRIKNPIWLANEAPAQGSSAAA
jgi:DNA polymerase-3 subunit epsilon